MLVAHRRAGKTVACVNDAIKRAIIEGKERARYAYIAPFYSQAKQVAWEYLKFYSAPLQAEEPRESDLSVKLINGAIIRLYGADNPNPLRGMYFDGVILDEYADMKPSVWPEVIRPMLTERKGWAVFIGTPKGKNAFWTIWDEARKEFDWFRVMLKASQTGILPAEELESARRAMSEDQYAQEFECSFEAAIHGAVYGKWMRELLEKGQITTVPHDPKLPVHTAWDLGYDDLTAIWWWQITLGEIRLIDYYEHNGEGIYPYCEQLIGRKIILGVDEKPLRRDGVVVLGDAVENANHRVAYTYGRHWVPPDAASELMAAGGRSMVNQAWDAGIEMSVLPTTSQQNSIEATRVTLPRCWFDEDRCKEGIEALRQYQFPFNEDLKTFASKPRHDWSSHGADAFEIIGRIWKTPESEKPKAQPRFLNDITAKEIFWPDKQQFPRRYDRI